MNRVSLNKRSDLSRPLTWAEMDSNWQKIADYLYSIGVSADNAESTANKALAIAGGSPFAGIAIPDGTPSVSSGVKSTYIAVQSGTYTNYGNLSVSSNEIAVLYYDGSEWSKTSMEVDFSEYIRTEAESETVPQPDVVTVDRAVSDGLGNNIPNTYATKTELVFPYVLDFSLLNGLNQDSTEENIYSALGGSGEFSHEKLSELLNKIASYSFIIAKDSLSNVPIAFTYSSGEYVLQFEYYENYNSIKIYPSSGVFKVKIGYFNAFQFNVLEQYIGEVNAKTSEVYANLDVIKGSGETNPSKIYIDGETLIPYVYKGGEFVPFKGGSNITPSYIEFESPILYANRAEISSMTRDGNVLYIGQHGGGYIAFDIEANKVIWNTSALNAGRSKQSLVVKGDYLYTIGDGNKSLQKYNKKDGSLILSITNADIISYNNMYIFVANDNLYFWSYITKTIYLVNEDDLSFAAIGKYDGVIESIDFSEYYGIIYTTDNHLIWLDTELNETSNLDTTEVTNISEQTNRIVRCTNNPNFCLLQSGMDKNYVFCIKNNGKNFSNSYCYTGSSIKTGNLLCSCSCEYNSNNINAILSLGILTGRNGLIYSDSSISCLPFVYSSAFNIEGKVYLCYGYRGLIKIQIV